MSSSKLQLPELSCLEPEHYKNFFRALFWMAAVNLDPKSQKKLSKKDRRRIKALGSVGICTSGTSVVLPNPSHFAVYSAIRKLIVTKWSKLPYPCYEDSDSENDEPSCSHQAGPSKVNKLKKFAGIQIEERGRCNELVPRQRPESSSPRREPVAGTSKKTIPLITGIGLRMVFNLIAQSRFSDQAFCEQSLKALLDVLQGHTPEEMAYEPNEIISNLHTMLVEIASGVGPNGRSEVPTGLTSLSSSCLIALSVARGEAELILNAVSSLIMTAPALSEQYMQVPTNLTTLQRSVQSVMLGPSSRNVWQNYGAPHQALVSSFRVDLPAQMTGPGELVIRALASDGCYIYVYTSKGLLKIGSGYGSSIRQHIYLYKPDFFASDRHGWMGYCKNKLYVRIGRKKPEVYEIDEDTLEMKNMIKLDPGPTCSAESKTAIFSDGNQLGLIMLSNHDNLLVRLYDTSYEPYEPTPVTLQPLREFSVHLLRRRTLALGRATFEDGIPPKPAEVDKPIAMQFDDNDDDPLVGICAGQDFGLLTTATGKVYYTGKGTSLGYKVVSPHTGRWTLMKETLFNRNEPNVKKCKVTQVAVGHEGVHAILVLDNGTALFTGIARRGEDGDSGKHRRTPKPTRPKKITKMDGHSVVYAACNNGSTALVTRQGLLFMFGKDTQYCSVTGAVNGLQNERVIQVALGKAHAIALTSLGQVYTFGINNKNQCGREFGYVKEKMCPRRTNKEEVRECEEAHAWLEGDCRICALCRQCTGFEGQLPPNSVPAGAPRERCGCGEGDAGCSTCGICRRCAETGSAARQDKPPADAGEEPDSMQAESKSGNESSKEGSSKVFEFVGACAGPSSADPEREAGVKVSSLAPARVAVPGGHRIVAVACGLHHSVMLTEQGEVLTFGSNVMGQLGAGDIAAHHRIVRVRLPRACAIAAGSNHTAVLTRDGELYTFGSYQKGSLGRPCPEEEPARPDRAPLWYATPGRVPRLGPQHACKAVWVSASGDQTFVQVSQSLIKTETLFSSTITANNNTIVILPNHPEHTFKCITINKMDGACNTWSGSEQVDFVNTLATLDPLYDVLWCYHPQMRVMKCFNILAFNANNLQRCFNDPHFCVDLEREYPKYGLLRRLEDFKDLETFENARCDEEKSSENLTDTNMSVLHQDLAIPNVVECRVTRMHASLHLLSCLDSLTYAHYCKLAVAEYKEVINESPVAPVMEDFLTVNRFEGHGGGWGYTGNSVEAIRFMCDTDIILGGYGLFGGRGDYTAKIKLFDIGVDGGDQENDGDVLAESDEIVYECAPRDRFPVLFDSPISITAHRWYVAWACVNGPSSDCGSAGQAMVINDEIGFHFKSSQRSNNGTDVNAGQIPCLLYNVMSADHLLPIRHVEKFEPVIVLSKNVSRKITVNCLKTLIVLMKWSWMTYKEMVIETNGLVPINYQKLAAMKHQKRLVYVVKACLRLVKSYINEICPQTNKRRNSHEYMAYFEAIGDVRNFIQQIMSEATPTCAMLPRKPTKNRIPRICLVQFALEMTNSILKEAHDTVTACFHAFFPTPTLKWNHLSMLLFRVKEGVVPATQIRELTSTCAAMCNSRSLQDVLQYIVPVTQTSLRAEEARRSDKCDPKVPMDGPSKSAKVPRSSSPQIPPPVPPRSNNREIQRLQEAGDSKASHTDWHLMDVVPRLLDIVLTPIKTQMMTRQCGKPHDHGEIAQHERLAEFCSKLLVRMVAELSYSASENREEMDANAVKHMITPSRFIRVNQNRAWNTGNGSPDSICFTVDRPGVMLVGACIYGGLGNYEYTLEVLHDLRTILEEPKPSHCWISVDIIHGTFNGEDCEHDMVAIKFERPILLKEQYRYAIRLCNHGGRTVNGDCGVPSVKGPDGTTFHFVSCSLSFNGTTMSRGQIPSLIYYGTGAALTNAGESSDALLTTLRTMTHRLGSSTVERSAELFSSLRNELTEEDLRRNATVLQQSPAINILLPFVLQYLTNLADAKTAVTVLELIHKILPHVGALNLLLPSPEEQSQPTHYYTWVESEHPYKEASVTNMRVLFPPTVSWMSLELDPRCITGQPEDTLTIFACAGVPKQKCQCTQEPLISESPFRKVYKRLVQLTPEEGEPEELVEDGDTDPGCTHHNRSYINVTPRLANVAAAYPQKAILVPGNEVIFSLETATDYLSGYSKSEQNRTNDHYGFRCLCVGYEDAPFTSQRQGLLLLEMELVHTGASCASLLLAPNLDLPLMSFVTLADIQYLTMWGAQRKNGSAVLDIDMKFVARGLEMSSPPTIHQVLDGQQLVRGSSTERQFLADFVAAAENTAGGRLAGWLAPMPCVAPSLCEMKPLTTTTCVGVSFNVPICLRDQYADLVISPSLKVEVMVRLLDHFLPPPRGMTGDYQIPNLSFKPTVRDSMTFQCITMMQEYENYSFEELRFASGSWNDGSIAEEDRLAHILPADRVPINTHNDGSYSATWVPRNPGHYIFTCLLDDLPVPQELLIEVLKPVDEESDDKAVQTGNSSAEMESRHRRFVSTSSSGLRVRTSPSLQAEEVGKVPPGAIVAFVEETSNKDGTWVRLSQESTSAYAYNASGVGIAWCLQHHRQLDMVLLVPIEQPDEDDDIPDAWSDDPQVDAAAWVPEEENGAGTSDPTEADDRKFPFSIDICDSDEGSRPFQFGAAEPSKRNRVADQEPSAAPSPKRVQRNGNSDDWWSIMRSNVAVQDANVQETAIGVHPEPQSQGSSPVSPDAYAEDALAHLFLSAASQEELAQEGKSPRSSSREQPGSQEPGQTQGRGSPPPLPSRGGPSTSRAPPPPPPAPPAPLPGPPAPRKYALSPTQAECLRAVFAALLWHEGVVHDAIACAAFLKFHPHLPRQGARVVTRGGGHALSAQRPQRHSVEVASAGQYFNLNPSTLETLTRSGEEACSSRERKSDIDEAIKEEDANADAAGAGATPNVVNVLPPALRALVALWDTLYDSDQLAVATDKYNKEALEKENLDDTRTLSGIRKRKDWKPSSIAKAPYSVRCELCGGASVPPPLGAHMRHAHEGCRASTNTGYDRAGLYRRADATPHVTVPAVCGQLAQAFQLWYIFCENCREKALRTAHVQKQAKSKVIAEAPVLRESGVDHETIKQNALFLLELTPLTNSEGQSGAAQWQDAPGCSPPTPAGSIWQPAPPFQCLDALGTAPTKRPSRDTARYHSLGRPAPTPHSPQVSEQSVAGPSGVHFPRVHRSVSMGQAGSRGLMAANRPPLGAPRALSPLGRTTLTASAGSSLLAQPSAALRLLIGCGDDNGDAVSAIEVPNVDPNALFRSHVLGFVLAKRELQSHRQKVDVAARISTVRQYACEALNWLLRSATQPSCVHDVMWWFCDALSRYSTTVPPVRVEEVDEAAGGAQPAANEPLRPVVGASTSALCPGGRSVRGVRAALYALLGSVSGLAPSLHPASAAILQAVRCWALHYAPLDRSFLHRSQIFNVISRILSHGEDAGPERAAIGGMHESFHGLNNKEIFVWKCPDITESCDVTVSSRQAMSGALVDESTETFWESGDEDRNKAKWIQVACPSGPPEDRPYLVCLHVDNTRDTESKTLLVSFLFSSGSNEMAYMLDTEIDQRSAAWVTYSLPRLGGQASRVRCELRGPEASVRVRQVRVLGAPRRHPLRALQPHALQPLVEHDTLGVFRLLTNQVFGKLLEWARIGAEGGEDRSAEEACECDLREHVVGILFAGHKLTTLQEQVMTHIVRAIKSEAKRVRDDWETMLLCELMGNDPTTRPSIVHDNYCFEMLSLLLALSGSTIGRVHLADRSELLIDLLSLLHTGSDRVQRQVITLLRRMITEIPPSNVLAQINLGLEVHERVTFLDYLVSYVGKALTVQMKVKGAGAVTPGSVTMGAAVLPQPPAKWFMRGRTSIDHSHLVTKLLLDMAEDRVSQEWVTETRLALATYATQVAQMSEAERRPDKCIGSPAMWMALAALCVCEQSYVELLNSSSTTEVREDAEVRSFCSNHDDGRTMAVVECRSCGPLCGECDRFLHLNRAARMHYRQICKEEECAIRINIHEGCGRAKLFWLLLLVDRRTLKGLAEFRYLEPVREGQAYVSDEGGSGMHSLAGTCRFCGARGTSGLLAIGNVCAEEQCQEFGREACTRVLACGHVCGGVRDEPKCLPCLVGCGGTDDAIPLRQDADDMCMICFTDPLQAAPSIQLTCGHVFHLHCCKKVLACKWIGPRITFSFSQCPICKEDMSHWSLEELLAPIRQLHDEVRRKAIMRLEYEGLAETPGRDAADVATIAMERYAYYVCHKCSKAYFGGLARCEAEANGRWEPTELVCGACSDVAGARVCPKHGSDFLEYKCRYCCSVAVFFCFGTSHFCNACHDDFQRVTNIPRHLLPHCPAGPKCEQLPGSAEQCPLHVQHPPTGEEFALGCGICRPSQTF